MNEQHPLDSTPIQEGVVHGPYIPTGNPIEQQLQQRREIDSALNDGNIDSDAHEQLDHSITRAKEDIEWDVLEARHDAAEEAERQRYLNGEDEEEESDPEREAGGGTTNQERIASTYFSDDELAHDDFDDEEDDKDPLEGDVGRRVHPDETRSDEQIAHDEEVSNRLHMSGDDGADEYWADYDEYHSDKPEPKAEDNYDFTERDIEYRRSATRWLEDVAADYEKQAEKFGRVKGDSNKPGVSAFAGVGLPMSPADIAESKALARVLENGFYATSDDNVYTALRTIETGTLRRAGYFSSWPDGSYKAAMDIKTTELDLDGLREFTDKFAELQRQREEVITKDGSDPLPSQMQAVFGAAGAEQ
jgi:hypothetical protein